MNAADIKEHMEIVGSDGQLIGRLHRVEGRSIKLTKDSPGAKGEHLFIPLDWVESVGRQVRLGKASADVREGWQAHPFREGEVVPEEAG